MSRTDKAPTPAPAAGAAGASGARVPPRRRRCGFRAPRAGPAAADRLPG